MRKKKIKLKKGNILIVLICIILITLIIISSSKIITWKMENDKTDDMIEHLIDIATSKDDDSDKKILENEDYDDTVKEGDAFHQFSEMDSLYIDFSELKAINSKTVGWIEVRGTNINLPYVQTKDNSYYLTHSFDNSYNSSGWAFLDYRNNKQELDRNNIIYAHGRKNGSMFGNLKTLLTKDWQSKSDNYIIRTLNEKENILWQIFSVYYLPTTNDYIQVKFSSDDEFETFINKMKNRSMFDFKTTVNKDDKILTLSTCYTSSDKLVVHAKMLKKEARN